MRLADTPFESRPAGADRQALLERLGATPLFWGVIIALIVFGGGVLRFHGLDWDQPDGGEATTYMHPDERFIAFVANDIDWPGFGDYFDTANSPLNPYNTQSASSSFVYGTFPIFLGKAVATMAGDDPSGPGNSYGNLGNVTWGRRLTATFDTLTIVLVMALGWTLFGRGVGLAAGGLYALSVLPTQLAHFWAVDPYVTFFAAAGLLCSARAVRASGRAFAAYLLLAGLAVGLGVASKATAFPIALAPALAVAVRIGLRDVPRLRLRWGGERPRPAGSIAIDIARLSLAAWVALFAFRVAQPYAFEGPNIWDVGINQQWWDDLQREQELQSGDVDFPPFVQFADRSPFLTPLRNIVLFGLGPGLGVAALAAMTVGGYLMIRRRELVFLAPLALAAFVFVFQALRFVAFMRYFEPMYPVFALFAGWGLVALWRASRSEAWRAGSVAKLPGALRGRLPFAPRAVGWGARALVVVSVAMTAWWALAFQSIYANEHTRIEASDWIYANVPDGSAITMELWDDALPYQLPGRQGQYQIVQTDPYVTDSETKVRELIYGTPGSAERTGLDRADYVVISSNRVRDSVVRLEREYPATIRYYELLVSGELGFERVATFKREPSFLGISVDDSSAEEAFTVYDHPEVWIFEKTDAWDADRAFALLMEAHPERAVNLLPGQGRTNGLQFTAAEAAVQQAGSTFSDIFDEDGFASRVPWLWWLLWLQLPALAALPWLTWVLRGLPDRGYGLSKLAGLASVALPVWLLVAWDVVDFSGGLVWLVYALALGGGALAFAVRGRRFLAEARSRWTVWLTLEAIFLVAFAVFLAFRYWNPDLWHPFRGGEKPMELAYLTAVVRSTELPPIDPWFGGGSMNYYYMGWFFLAVPIRALRIVPEVAFNLAIPTYAALTAIGAASIVHNLVALSRGRAGTWPQGGARPGLFAAAGGAILLIGIGNLDGAHQLIERIQSVNEWSFLSGTPVLGGAVGIAGGLYEWAFGGASLPPFDWWRSSRVHFGQFDITEFPYWTYLFADLHPHLMAMPFFGAMSGLAVAYGVSASRGLRRQTWVIAALLGLGVGLMRTVHTWDWPTALIVAAGAILLGQLFARGRWDLRLWRGAGHLAVAAAFVVVPFIPYTAHFEVFEAGLHRAEETTEAQQYFAHFGLFVVIAAAFVAVRCHEELRAGIGRNVVLASVMGRWERLSVALFVLGLAAFTWTFGLTVVALSVVAEVYLLNLIWREWRNPDRDAARALATAMLALAVAVAAGVDVVTVNNDIVRMNTVFKFSLQAWQLYAFGSGYALWYVGRALLRIEGWRPKVSGRAAAVGGAWAGTTALFFFAAGVFLVSGTPERQEERFTDTGLTLDGLVYLESAPYNETLGNANPDDDVMFDLAEDEPLIRWLRDNVAGTPVIAEASGPLYHWTSRITWYTGLPAVIGWDWHQRQQRWDYGHLIDERVRDTQRFYRDPDTTFAQEYLRKYNVRYVIVGTNEHAFGTPEGLAKLDGLAGVREVFREGEGVIYEVDQAALLVAAVP